MSKKCMGCGATLQTSDVHKIGYVKDLEQNYCVSCYRLRHYRDFKRVQVDVNDSDTLAFIESFTGHIFWVVDVLRLSQSLHSGLVRSLRNKRVVLLVNKIDLLPKSVSPSKLKYNILNIFKDECLDFEDIIFVSSKKKDTLKALDVYIQDDKCAFVGSVNAGKSSLLNQLFGNEELSVSPVASTTAQVIELNERLYDTPGLRSDSKVLKKLSDEMLVKLAPQKTLKPQVFQIYEPQSFILGDLGAITLYPKGKASVVSYIPFEVKRVKPDRVKANLELEHEFKLESTKYRKRSHSLDKNGLDFEVFDIGFLSINGVIERIETYLDESVDFAMRRNLL